MVPYMADKAFLVSPPVARVNTASLVVSAIDTWGYAWLRVRLLIGVTDIAFTVWKLQNCDTSGGSYADVPNTTASGTTGDSRLPQATDSNTIFDIMVNLKGLARFYKPVATVGTGSAGAFVAAVAEMYFAEQAPSTSALQGVNGRIIA
jgi:hypothetical protein